jgi:hypothetical protein
VWGEIVIPPHYLDYVLIYIYIYTLLLGINLWVGPDHYILFLS